MRRWFETVRQTRRPDAVQPPRYRYVRRRWWVLFGLLDFFGRRLAAFAAWMRPAVCPNPDAPVRRVLLVQLDHLGDAVLSTGLVTEVARRYLAARIEVLAAPWNAEIFSALPQVARVHVCHSNRFARRGRWTWPMAVFYWGLWLRRRQFDLGIDIRGEFPLALILWLAGIGRRVGWAAGGGGFLLTDSARYDPAANQIAARGLLLDAIDRLAAGSSSPPAPRFDPPARDSAWAKNERSRLGPGPLVVAHISAGTAAKRWPASHWQEFLGRLLLELPDVHLAIVGGESDRALADEIFGQRDWPRVTDFVGRLSICRLAALLEQADCFVGADSGPAHLARAVGARAVVMFSGTNDPSIWRPAGDARVLDVLSSPADCAPCHRTQCPLADHPCMRGIAPELVAAAVIGKLRMESRPPAHAAAGAPP